MSWYTERRNAIKSKAKDINKKFLDVRSKLNKILDIRIRAGLDAKIKLIPDESFFKMIDKFVIALDNAIDKTSQEFKNLTTHIFQQLLELEQQIEKIINLFFENVSLTIEAIQKNLIEPTIAAISQLEKQIYRDIINVMDKIFDFCDGKTEEFKQDILKNYGNLLIPNPLDSCRQQLHLGLTPGFDLTYADVFNLFECKQLKRLENKTVTVKEIKEIYAVLNLQAFKMTCLGRGSPPFQEIYMQKWLDYAQLLDMWKEFDDNMTQQEAYNEAIRRLNLAKDEYLARVADIALIKETADNALNIANKGLSGSVKNIKFFTKEVLNDTTKAESEVVVTFEERVDAVFLESIINDGHDMWTGSINRIGEKSFKVTFKSARGEGVRWIPSLRFVGVQVER